MEFSRDFSVFKCIMILLEIDSLPQVPQTYLTLEPFFQGVFEGLLSQGPTLRNTRLKSKGRWGSQVPFQEMFWDRDLFQCLWISPCWYLRGPQALPLPAALTRSRREQTLMREPLVHRDGEPVEVVGGKKAWLSPWGVGWWCHVWMLDLTQRQLEKP